MIKALIFDFDGLILDTESAEYEALQRVYGRYGHSLSMDLWGACIGTQHEFDPLLHLKQTAQLEVPIHELRRMHQAEFHGLMQGRGPMPGVVEYLQSGKSMGLGLAVASSSPRHWVKGYLEDLGLLSWFDVICTAEDVHAVKPDPALYTTAAARLGVRPAEAVAFEDSPNGATAAKRAGLYCVVVPNSVTQCLPFGEIDLRLNSLAELSLSSLLERLAESPTRRISWRWF